MVKLRCQNNCKDCDGKNKWTIVDAGSREARNYNLSRNQYLNNHNNSNNCNKNCNDCDKNECNNCQQLLNLIITNTQASRVSVAAVDGTATAVISSEITIGGFDVSAANVNDVQIAEVVNPSTIQVFDNFSSTNVDSSANIFDLVTGTIRALFDGIIYSFNINVNINVTGPVRLAPGSPIPRIILFNNVTGDILYQAQFTAVSVDFTIEQCCTDSEDLVIDGTFLSRNQSIQLGGLITAGINDTFQFALDLNGVEFLQQVLGQETNISATARISINGVSQTIAI